jgi:hypothetical protein
MDGEAGGERAACGVYTSLEERLIAERLRVADSGATLFDICGWQKVRRRTA